MFFSSNMFNYFWMVLYFAKKTAVAILGGTGQITVDCASSKLDRCKLMETDGTSGRLELTRNHQAEKMRDDPQVSVQPGLRPLVFWSSAKTWAVCLGQSSKKKPSDAIYWVKNLSSVDTTSMRPYRISRKFPPNLRPCLRLSWSRRTLMNLAGIKHHYRN